MVWCRVVQGCAPVPEVVVVQLAKPISALSKIIGAHDVCDSCRISGPIAPAGRIQFSV